MAENRGDLAGIFGSPRCLSVSHTDGARAGSVSQGGLVTARRIDNVFQRPTRHPAVKVCKEKVE